MRLFIGSTNAKKIEAWKDYLPDWSVLSYEELGLGRLQIEEGLVSLRENALGKARAWAAASGELTLSDDTGFFVQALGGRPGVSVKRWGGQFPAELDSVEFLRHLGRELEGIEDTVCHFETVYALALPSGEVRTFADRLDGFIDKALIPVVIERGGGPLGCVFRQHAGARTWREMSGEERRQAELASVRQLERLARELLDIKKE